MIPTLLLAVQAVTVSPSGPVTTIGEAVRQATPGDRIVVRPGRYREPTVVVDRPVAIVAEGVAVLDAGGEGTALLITADGVTVRGLTIEGTGAVGSEDRAAVRLRGVRGASLEGNLIRNAQFGILGQEVRESRIVGNRIQGPGEGSSLAMVGNAIHCWSCREVAILDNEVRGHRDGIYLEFTTGGRIEGNQVEQNLRYGLHFMFSDSSTYRDNTFRDNAAGVAVMYTRRVTMEGNRFEWNRGPAAYGLLLKEISDSRVVQNSFAGNTVGLYLENSNRNHVEGNRFSGNGRAVRVLANAVGNEFRENVFLQNTFDVTTNSRSATSRFEGNYWDHYRGYDLDRDGFGDVPYRPVRLFALLVEQNAPALVLLRSSFVDLLDLAERVLPVLTPAELQDTRPRMSPPP